MSSVKEIIKRKNGRNHGEVFTKKNVVLYILDEVNYNSSEDLRNVKILEPASGNGAFAVEIIKRLYKSSLLYEFSFIDALESNVRLVEKEISSYILLGNELNNLVKSFNIKYNFLNSQVLINSDYLLHSFKSNFNCIVGNPPYIRHELIPNNLKNIYKTNFKTFKYRADLYILFFERSLELLEKNGILSFICSNRWLYNQYGQLLRNEISQYYNLKKLLNIENSSPFDESVIAYPCITTIENKPNLGKTLYFESNSKDIDFDYIPFREVESPIDYSWQNLFLEYNLNHQALVGILEQNFEIGIGVATGADKVFIIKEKDKIEESRLLPILTSKDLSNNGITWKKQFVINPYENGELCDLELYPKLKKHLNSNKKILLKRHTAIKSPEKWYKTIDKIKPDLLKKPKLLLPDITGIKKLLIDTGNFYPHHNLYYIVGENVSSLKILACILMSDFIREQLSQIGIRMNGGFPRFQSQVLKKIRIPNIKLIETTDKLDLISAYDNLDFEKINEIINKYCTQHVVKLIGVDIS